MAVLFANDLSKVRTERGSVTANRTGRVVIEDRAFLNDLLPIAAAYAQSSPFCHALFRTLELAPFAGVELIRPILDLGCGTGEFARNCVSGTLDVGVDKCRRVLRCARRTRKYASVTIGNCECLPFSDQSFQTVISISALEHMQNIPNVLDEAHRVLDVGGKLLLTVTTAAFYDHSPTLAVLRRRLGPGVAKFLEVWHKRVFNHCSLWTTEDILRQLQMAGFEIDDCRKCISPANQQLCERGLPAAAPHALLRRLGIFTSLAGSRRNRIVAEQIEECLQKETGNGACAAIVATRKSP